jgi:hypothetical protein
MISMRAHIRRMYTCGLRPRPSRLVVRRERIDEACLVALWGKHLSDIDPIS